jgi:hypothetical protein
MDEVIADSFSKHLRHYNEQTGENLTHEMVTHNGLRPLIPDKHKEIYNRVPFADDFFRRPGSDRWQPGRSGKNFLSNTMFSSPALPWMSLLHSTPNTSGWKDISPSFLQPESYSAETSTLSMPTC